MRYVLMDMMGLSRTEFKVLKELIKGVKTVNDIAIAVKKSDKQIYMTTKKLREKKLIEQRKGLIEPNKFPHINLLFQLISKHPNIDSVLSDSGIPILTSLLQPSTIEEIIIKTGLKRSIIYKKLNEANKRSIIMKTNSRFRINEKLWGELKAFLEELKKVEALTDERIPASATIYYKNEKEILFSCQEELDAAKTAFSAYEQYGIKILMTTNYYYLPKRKITMKEVLTHTLYVVEKEPTIRNLIFLSLFYAKHKRTIKIQHPILKNIDRILKRENIKGYPSYKEVKDRAEIYGIKV